MERIIEKKKERGRLCFDFVNMIRKEKNPLCGLEMSGVVAAIKDSEKHAS